MSAAPPQPMASALQVPISLAERSYNIHIGSGLLADPASWAGLPVSADALIVSNTTVAPLFAERLRAQLAAHHRRVLLAVQPSRSKVS